MHGAMCVSVCACTFDVEPLNVGYARSDRSKGGLHGSPQVLTCWRLSFTPYGVAWRQIYRRGQCVCTYGMMYMGERWGFSLLCVHMGGWYLVSLLCVGGGGYLASLVCVHVGGGYLVSLTPYGHSCFHGA